MLAKAGPSNVGMAASAVMIPKPAVRISPFVPAGIPERFSILEREAAMNSTPVIFGEGASAIVAGLLLGLGSTISIGPNNLLMLREGLIRGRIGIVTGVVLGSSLMLLFASDLAADLLSTVPAVFKVGLTWMGFLVLAFFALRAARASLTSTDGLGNFQPCRERAAACLRRVAMNFWFNPLCYLEYLIVPAAICETYATGWLRAAFVFGLMIMAVLNSILYILGGKMIIRFANTPRSLQFFDALSSLVLGGVAIALGYKLVSGGL